MTGLFQDGRYAARRLRKSPGFTTVCIITLALGIGVNTAIFSLLDSVLLRTLPVVNPDRLVTLSRFTPAAEGESFTYPQFEQLCKAEEVFSGVFGFAYRSVNVTIAGHFENVAAQLASGQFFSTLGVPAALGRTLYPEDNRVSGVQPAAVLSYRYWQQRFAADPSIVGKTVTVAGTSVTIVGVMPSGFYGTSLDYSADVWLPITMQPRIDGSSNLLSTGINWVMVMARLKPAIPLTRAITVANLTFVRYLRSINADPRLLEQRIQIESGGRPVSGMRTDLSPTLAILMTIVGLVLLLSCTNIANLMLARSAGQRRQITVRLAIGAGRVRVIQQLLTESLLLALLGGSAAIAFALLADSVLLRFVAKITNRPTPLQLQFHPDLRVLTFTAVVSLVAGAIFGVVPALRATRVNLVSGLKESIGSGFSPGLRLNKVLLVSQLAICLPVLVAAGLFIRSLQRLTNLDLGFDPTNVVQIKSLVLGSSHTPAQLTNGWKEILGKIRATPGVLSASASLPGLFSHSTYQSVVFIGGEQLKVYTLAATDGYFRTLQIPLLAGRDFSSADNASTPAVAIVNQALARLLSANSNPVGQILRNGLGTKPFEIIGVAKDTKYDNVLADVAPMVYVPLAQLDLTPGFRVFEVRTSSNPSVSILTFPQIIASVDPDLPAEIRPLADSIGESLLTQHLTARATTFLGFLGLLLTCTGLYGLMSYVVTQGTTEIGIRIAMGANGMKVLKFTMKQAAILVLVGTGIGLFISVIASRLVGPELVGLQATDPTSFATATALMLLVAALAAYLPAHRAAKLDPVIALRNE